MLNLDPKMTQLERFTQTSFCMLIHRTFSNVIAKLEKKLLKKFYEIGKNVKIGIFCLILAYISVSRHDIGETKKLSGAISPRYMPTKFRINTLSRFIYTLLTADTT